MKLALEAEGQYDLLQKLMKSTDLESAFITIESAIPCILHGGNRLGEKVFMMLLIEAMRNCSTKGKWDEVIDVVESFVNTGAFGTQYSCSQCMLSKYARDRKSVV